MPSASRAAPRWAPRSALPLAGLVAASFVARFLVALGRPTPNLFPDEYTYAQLGRSIASFGRPLVRGQLYHFPALLEPVLTAPAWLVGDPSVSYRLIQALGALAMSLAAVPVFLVGFTVLHLPTPLAVIAWLKSAQHDWGSSLNLLSVPRAAYGFARTFLFLEFCGAPINWAGSGGIPSGLSGASWSCGFDYTGFAGPSPIGSKPMAVFRLLDEPARSRPKMSRNTGAMEAENVVQPTTPRLEDRRGR